MSKYQYWTLIEKVGKTFKDRIKKGEFISADYKKESWEVLNRQKNKIEFMCSGRYICRTLTKLSVKEKLKIITNKIKQRKLLEVSSNG
jgi:hypothetical protein